MVAPIQRLSRANMAQESWSLEQVASTIASAIKFSSKQKGHSGVTSKAGKKTLFSLHKVKANETLYSIAKKYRLSLEELRRINGLPSTIISVNQFLKVPKNV